MCGEKQELVIVLDLFVGSPPHVRGKEKGGVKVALISRITPACAGKSQSESEAYARREDHPRMCGEKRKTV